MSITIYPSQFNMREDGGYEQLPAIKGETGEQGVPGVGALPGGAKGQVPVKQSADDYDVAWEDIGWTKVWENASPGSTFSAQTIALSLSGYVDFLISYSNFTTADAEYGYISVPCIKGIVNVLQVGSAVSNRNGRRTAQISDTGIAFSGCTYNNAAQNGFIVPYRIYAR